MPKTDYSNSQTSIKTSLIQRIQLGVLLGFIGILIWGANAELDIVVSARGEIVSQSDVEKIQHREGGILEKLLVKEGDYIYEGQEIARLRAMERDSELGAMQHEITRLKMTLERVNALIFDRIPDFQIENGTSELIALNQKKWTDEISKNKASDDLFIHDIAHKNDLIKSMKNRLKSSQDQLLLIREQLDIKEQLYREDIVPYMDVLNMRVQDMNMHREVQNLEEAILNEKAGVLKSKIQLRDQQAKRVSDYMEKLTDTEKDLKVKISHLPNVTDQVSRLTVVSPVDGYVDEIHFNYQSAVIPPGESIADITPLRSRLIAEAKIPRKEVGFVEVGQDARVKIDTYSFTKYGSLDGKIIAISKASYEEKEQMFYRAKIELSKSYLEYNGAQFHISPDMEFVADIKTGSRNVLDYALKPIMTALEQSFGER